MVFFFVWVIVYQKNKFNLVEFMGQLWVGLYVIISDYGILVVVDRFIEKLQLYCKYINQLLKYQYFNYMIIDSLCYFEIFIGVV